jgi:hypothetical protein
MTGSFILIGSVLVSSNLFSNLALSTLARPAPSARVVSLIPDMLLFPVVTAYLVWRAIRISPQRVFGEIEPEALARVDFLNASTLYGSLPKTRRRSLRHLIRVSTRSAWHSVALTICIFPVLVIASNMIADHILPAGHALPIVSSLALSSMLIVPIAFALQLRWQARFDAQRRIPLLCGHAFNSGHIFSLPTILSMILPWVVFGHEIWRELDHSGLPRWLAFAFLGIIPMLLAFLLPMLAVVLIPRHNRGILIIGLTVLQVSLTIAILYLERIGSRTELPSEVRQLLPSILLYGNSLTASMVAILWELLALLIISGFLLDRVHRLELRDIPVGRISTEPGVADPEWRLPDGNEPLPALDGSLKAAPVSR